jgi:hypothetical protein
MSSEQLKRRIRGVRRRKQTHKGYECEVLATKMRLVRKVKQRKRS